MIHVLGARRTSRAVRRAAVLLLLGASVMMSSMATNAATSAEPSTLTVATFNIRYANRGDGANAWPHRKEAVAEILREHRVDFAGLQEVLHSQLLDLKGLLAGYEVFGVGRDDGRERGEYSPILFRADRWKLIGGTTRWLSLTPEVPGSKSWDAAITRIATRCEFEERATGRRFVMFNTHFDHQGRQARLESAKLLRSWGATETLPTLLTGDFNCVPTDPPYAELTAAGPEFRWLDSRSLAGDRVRGPDSTWNGFREIVPMQRIDYVFVDRRWEIDEHRTDDRRIERTGESPRFPSDHLPVIVKLRWKAD